MNIAKRMKVLIKLFQKFAERETASRDLDLETAQPMEKYSERGACCAADSPRSGRKGTQYASS